MLLCVLRYKPAVVFFWYPLLSWSLHLPTFKCVQCLFLLMVSSLNFLLTDFPCFSSVMAEWTVGLHYSSQKAMTAAFLVSSLNATSHILGFSLFSSYAFSDVFQIFHNTLLVSDTSTGLSSHLQSLWRIVITKKFAEVESVLGTCFFSWLVHASVCPVFLWRCKLWLPQAQCMSLQASHSLAWLLCYLVSQQDSLEKGKENAG